MACKQGDLLQIRGLRVQGEIPHLHVFRHALSKGSHGELLCEVELAAQQPLHAFAEKTSQNPTLPWVTRNGLKGRSTGYRVAV
jgi:hypothetical protein